MRRLSARGEAGPDLGTERLGEATERWLDRALLAADRQRAERWQPRFETTEAFLASLAARRQKLASLLRLPEVVSCSLRRTALAPHRGARLEEWRWEPRPGLALEALYVRPIHASGAAVVLCHSLSGGPEQMLGDAEPTPFRALSDGLLAAGTSLIIPRLVQGWERRLRLTRKARLIGLEWTGLEAWGLLCLYDALASLPELDPAAIGLYGFSRGGQTALLLAALDQRWAAVGVASWFTNRARRLVDRDDPRQPCFLESPEEEQFVPDWVTEFSDVGLAWLVAPRPLLVTSGLDDPVLAYEDVEESFVAASEPYRRLGGPEQARLALFVGGHEPLPSATVDFYVTWL
ncbi:MAG: hypothetical protein HUU35_02180, partial [Armatimonadetes bacterium]|nr:hypothetical protein [Armatimonadota bacterium]